MPQMGMRIGLKHSRRGGAMRARETFLFPTRKRRNGRRNMAQTIVGLLAVIGCLAGPFAAIHYVPAVVYPTNALKLFQRGLPSLQEKSGPIALIVDPVLDALHRESGYIRDGERLEARYALAPNRTADLEITKCARRPILEIFDCRALERIIVRVDSRSKRKRIQLPSPGYYHFHVVEGQGARILWNRV